MDEDQILTLVRQQGPSIPVQISKKIGTNILFASAMMGDLVSKGKLKITKVKVGGTPLYYTVGQESALQQFSKHLHEKERKAYEILKENKILRDKEQEPVVRVALREIKDYAVPLEVSFNNGTEIFWKWYLLSKDEASQLIRAIIEPFKNQEPRNQEPKRQEPERPTEQKKPEEPPRKQEPERPTPEKPKKEPESQKSKEPKQVVLDPVRQDEPFANTIYKFFKNKEIDIKDEKMIRKGTDLEFVVKLPSAIGSITYFVKARSKKTSNDGDLSSAFLQGQRKNLPVLYLTTGKVTKKGKETAKKDFPSMVIEEI